MLRSFAAIVIVATGLCIMISADFSDIRHGSARNASVCIGQQILNLPKETDVLLIGSSRMRRGISAQRIDEILADGSTAYNLGRPGLSAARSFVLLRDLFDRGLAPQVVVLETAVEAIRNVDDLDKDFSDWRWRADTAAVLKYADVFALPKQSADAGIVGQFALVSQAVFSKLENNISRRTAGDLEDLNLPEGTKPEQVCFLPEFDNPSPDRIKHNAASKEKAKSKVMVEIGDPYTDYDDRFAFELNSYVRTELYYLEKIRNLLDTAGTEFLLIRVHPFARPPYSDRVLAELEAVLPEFVEPPADILRQTYADFIDPAHMGPASREIYTGWISEEIEMALTSR